MLPNNILKSNFIIIFYIQVVRRVGPVVHMLLVLFLLDAVGLENLTRYEPHGTVVSEQ